MIGPVIAFLLFVAVILIAIWNRKVENRVYIYYPPSTNMYVNSSDKYDIHLLSVGFQRVKK